MQQRTEALDAPAPRMPFERGTVIGEHPVKGPSPKCRTVAASATGDEVAIFRRSSTSTRAKRSDRDNPCAPPVASRSNAARQATTSVSPRCVSGRNRRAQQRRDRARDRSRERDGRRTQSLGIGNGVQQGRRRDRRDQDLGALFPARRGCPRTGDARRTARHSPVGSFPSRPPCVIRLRPRVWKSNMKSSEPARLTSRESRL